MAQPTTPYQNRGLMLRLIGAGLFLAGVACLLIGPLEIYTFYAFSDGGKHHFEGFGMGSFMFAYITIQVIGYYLLGTLGVVVGYAHLRLIQWLRPVMVTLLWLWLLIGIPGTVSLLCAYTESKEPPESALLWLIPLAFLAWPVAPVILLRFYRGHNVRQTLANHPQPTLTIETIPVPVRLVSLLLTLVIMALHAVFLLRGIFPWFGVLLAEGPGVLAADVLILLLVGITWGLLKHNRWAWGGSLLVLGLFTLSALLTFPHYTFGDILTMMQLPPTEMDIFSHVPFWEAAITPVVVGPLLLLLAALLGIGRYYGFRPLTGKSNQSARS